MVDEFIRNGKILYQCEICEMVYRKLKMAVKCEIGCKNDEQCKGKMVRHSVHFSIINP